MRKISLLACWLLVVGCWLLVSGCADRKMTIRSEPEGAKVLVDSKEMGVTPCTFPFTYYGTRQIILEKQGFQTLQVLAPIRPPLLQVFPFDILILLVPYPIRDYRTLTYKLAPYHSEDVNVLLKRGEELKEYLNKQLESGKK